MFEDIKNREKKLTSKVLKSHGIHARTLEVSGADLPTYASSEFLPAARSIVLSLKSGVRSERLLRIETECNGLALSECKTKTKTKNFPLPYPRTSRLCSMLFA